MPSAMQVDEIAPRSAPMKMQDGAEFMPKIDSFLEAPEGEAPAPAESRQPAMTAADTRISEALDNAPPPVKLAATVPATPPARPAAPAVREPPVDLQPAIEPEPETPGEPEVQPPPEVSKDPKANHAWEQLRKDSKRAKELEAELTKLKTTKTPELEELAALKTQVQEYEAKIGQLDLRESKAFKVTYDERLKGLFERGVNLATRAGVETEEAVRLMQQLVDPSRSVEDLQQDLSGLPMPVQGSLYSLVTDFADLRTARENALSEWQETRAKLHDTEQRSSIADMSKQIVEDTNQAIEALRSEENFLFMESQSDQQWNGEVQDRIRSVRAILRDSPREELVKYVADGVTAPVYRSLYKQALAKVDKLQRELNARLGARPDVGGGRAVDSQPPAAARKAPRSPEQVLEAEFPEGGQTMRW